MKKRKAILKILNMDVGFAIDLFGGLLWIGKLENGQTSVQSESLLNGKSKERLFDDVEEGVDFFLKMRKRKKLGFDFEKLGFEEKKK